MREEEKEREDIDEERAWGEEQRGGLEVEGESEI